MKGYMIVNLDMYIYTDTNTYCGSSFHVFAASRSALRGSYKWQNSLATLVTVDNNSVFVSTDLFKCHYNVAFMF